MPVYAAQFVFPAHSLSRDSCVSRFGFRIAWATNASVVVEASTSLATPSWLPIATNTLTMGADQVTDGWSDFRDPDPSTQPARFYRLRSP